MSLATYRYLWHWRKVTFKNVNNSGRSVKYLSSSSSRVTAGPVKEEDWAFGRQHHRVEKNLLKKTPIRLNKLNHLNPALGVEGRIITPQDESWDFSDVMKLMPLLKTTATGLIGTWNVRTMWETGRTKQIAMEMRKYNLTVLGVSETNWT